MSWSGPASARLILVGVLPALACPGAVRAAADPTDALQLFMTAGLLSDDNLFRLPEGDPRAFGIDPSQKSDTIRRIGGGIKFDKSVSRQRFIANLNVENNTYARNSQLDHTAGNAGAKWLWALGNLWSGEAAWDHRRRLSGFADLSANNVAANTKNMVDQDLFSINGGYRFHPRWRGWGGLDVLESENSAPSLAQNDVRITTHSFGAEYRTPSDNSLGLQVKFAEGRYPNRQVVATRLVDNEYSETVPSFTWAWNLSGLSRFDGRLGYAVRKHEQFSARDYSGPTFQLHYQWLPTGKLRFDANAWRELWTAETDTSSYLLARGFRIAPQWAITQKTSLRGVLSLETRAYLGDPGVLLPGAQAREDRLRTLQLAAVYVPWRNAEFIALLEHGSRTSNQPNFAFDYDSALLNLKLNF